MTATPWIVIKFGGNSVADLTAWQTIAEITHQHLQQQRRPLIVCSALSGITNKLEKLIDAALRGEQEPILSEIIANYQALATSLNVENKTDIQRDFEKLKLLTTGIALLQEASAATRAKILSFGEIILTKLGAAYLQDYHFPTTWCDARELLKSIDPIHDANQSHYLFAKCAHHKDEEVIQKLNPMPTPVVITQGFIASNERGETVILGRGGSDTSAAYFAAKLNAIRCEIWTDVPGIYTANPHEIPQAKLLKSLDYDEAQEVASMGAKVLHPYCVPPLKVNAIPLYVGYTRKPHRPGTEININGRHQGVPIKFVITKYNILLIQIETLQMWQQAGFLAKLFEYFKKHDLSIELVSTSETNVTVSIDLKPNSQDKRKIENLLADLNTFCKATTIGPCAAISLVGPNIRAALHKIGHTLKVFEQQKIYLLSQSANDLNLTFVVEEEQASRLAKKLHTLLIEENTPSHVFEQSWHDEFMADKLTKEEGPWWKKRLPELIDLAERTSPLYVYEKNALQESINSLKNMKSIQQIFYAMKANYHPAILKLFFEQGLGFECVSLGEINCLFNLFPNIDPKRIVFTPNFAPREEYEKALELGVYVTVDNLHPFQHWAKIFSGREVILRLDPGKGHGHHQHVCTGGENSKFGIPISELVTLKELLKRENIRVIGLHTHQGSGILDYHIWPEVAKFLTDFLAEFPEVSIINIGGGLGIPEKPGQKALDLSILDNQLAEIQKNYPNVQMWLEPGRFLVAQAGILLAKVTQTKKKGEITFIGINAGMNSLIRPSLYGSYHEIVNLTRIDEKKSITAHVVGPICESGDTLGFSRSMPVTQEGDVILIANAGAYGHVMASNYNLRRPAEEYFLI